MSRTSVYFGPGAPVGGETPRRMIAATMATASENLAVGDAKAPALRVEIGGAAAAASTAASASARAVSTLFSIGADPRGRPILRVLQGIGPGAQFPLCQMQV